MRARLEIQRLAREHHGWVLARLVRTVRDLDLAEDALQDALLAALRQWPEAGIPDDPRAWLVSAARNKAIDALRHRALRTKKAEELGWLEALRAEVAAPPEGPIRDDMLRLVFTCCHPALSLEARVALTLRAVAGLETEEIARAFLVPVPTMAQRLVRAKNKIKAAGIPFAVPGASDMPPRLESVLAVLYLVFNEGYAATSGAELVRRDLCGVALRLARALAELLPQEGEVLALYGLMLLHDARAEARSTPAGDLVLLADQNRARWDRAQVARGLDAVQHSLRLGAAGVYTVQAAIAAVHAEAETAEDTDWPQIVGLYDALMARAPTPVVALNRAVAVAMARGPAAGLALLEELAGPLAEYHLYHAARADLLRRMGARAEAAAAYRRALETPCNAAERRFLEGRLAAVE
ncbi:MAG: sigma-70 family RNA polymerase sigma factor [Myxococcales bacterium]|nr:sigma-70 family RNA polymerase sigma factor [Myxococcales bacterium]